ncbi:hypothetical protein AALO_G00156430 [Alosa alosa]|uniref:Uncharacterized protein n=1 Tax=Alosa alosa TaxID=278164 RepID=A0AAV6GF96_9TELE|nr:hypothetical protein AALO_G00156430 [Alosa alosa]
MRNGSLVGSSETVLWCCPQAEKAQRTTCPGGWASVPSCAALHPISTRRSSLHCTGLHHHGDDLWSVLYQSTQGTAIES